MENNRLINPVFLVCSERSGSNLIRSIFDTHKNFCAPMPLHLMQYILKYNSYYNKIKNLDKSMIINHFIKIIDNGVGKINIKLNSENIKNNIQNHDFMEIFDYIYSSVCKNKRLFYKENHVYDFIPAIIKKYPNAKFIIQVRDPRDFALSMVKRSYEIHDIFRAISVWNRDQKML